MSDAGVAQPDVALASEGRRESEGDIREIGDEELRRRIEALEMSAVNEDGRLPPASEDSLLGSTARGDSPTFDSTGIDSHTLDSTGTNSTMGYDSTRGFDSKNPGSTGRSSTQRAPSPPGDVVLNGPHAVLALDGAVRCVMVADCWANRLLIVSREGMEIAAIGCGDEGHADGPGRGAAFHGPHGLSTGIDGEILVCDAYNQCIRMVLPLTLDEGADDLENLVQAEVVTVAGSGKKGITDGHVSQAAFCYPHDITVAPGPDNAPALIACDFDNNCLRRIVTHDNRPENVTTWAGSALGAPGLKDGRLQEALFDHPGGVATCPETGDLFVADTYNHAIRILYRDASGIWHVDTIAGGNGAGYVDGGGRLAKFNNPTGIVVGAGGEVAVADFNNSALRVLTCSQTRAGRAGIWRVGTLVGRPRLDEDTKQTVGERGYVDGPLERARMNRPHGVSWDAESSRYLVADCFNNRVRWVGRESGVSTLI